MMYSAVALFCEDIREEKSGTDTIVGVFPDNVNVPTFPFTFAKIAIYLRINMPADSDSPKRIEYWLTSPDNIPFPRTPIEAELIERARRDAMERGSVIGGTISKAVIGFLQLKTPGRLNLVVEIDGRELVAGTLNVQPNPS